MVKKIHTFHDAITSTATGTDLDLGFDMSPDGIIVVDITGTATARTVDFYGKSQNGNYIDLYGYNLSTGSGAITTSGTTDELWKFNIGGLTGLRCDVSAVSGGNLTVMGRIVV